MGMTMTEKILARSAGKAAVSAGENVWVNVDLLMTHDVCGPATIGIFKERFGADARVWDSDKVVIIPDHYIFTKDEKARRNVEILREFAVEQRLPYFYDVGTDRYKGVCHLALPEEGHTRPGEILLGTDSHTCTHGAFGEFATGIGNTEAGFVLGTGKLWLKAPPTMQFLFEGELPPYLMAKDLILRLIADIGVDGATYRAIESAGPAIAALNMEERMTLCNMAIEAGAKNGIIAADGVTLQYVRERTARAGTKQDFEPVADDADAAFHSVSTYNVDQLEPMVAQPHSPDRGVAVRELAGTKLDRAYIGSCTGGKITDFLAAARMMRGREAKLETFIVPATTEVDRALDMMQVEGRSLRDIFEAAGARVGPPSCAACLGGPIDTFGRMNEPLACISTTNRNFPGRMGHKEGLVYLASPLTAAASAVAGKLADPRDFLT